MKAQTLNQILFGFVSATLLLSASVAQAAPMPGTASSALVAPKLGLYRSPMGFQVSAGESGWIHAEAPKHNKYVATVYRSPKAEADASLTIRVDKLPKEVALDKYVQRWMKEYPKYGFDVLGSKPFSQNKQRGYVLDLINRDNGKQLRQAVFVKNQKAVILTCRDQAKSFKNSLKDCNTIIRTFTWTE